MIRLGEKQTLEVVKTVDFGVYLAPSENEKLDKVLLPIKYAKDLKMGDEVEVFVYRDSEDRLISTTVEPLIKMGEVRRLTVSEVSKIGAFLNWGLEKDLFLPFKQQTRRVQKGDEILVSIYIDKSDRIAATMNVYESLYTNAPYKKDDTVTGEVYLISENFGAFVAVDDCYSALIPTKELYGEIKVGDTVSARVAKVLEDGKLTLSVREKAYLQIEKDAERILDLINSYDGVLPFNDKVSPEVIKREIDMSKNEFKRAVGNLKKRGIIEITEKSIRLINR